MREILFKAKRTDNGEWVEGYYFAQGNGCDSLLSYIKRVTDTVHVDPATVCEYTGLLDKNGVRIFEGDIVRYKDKEDTTVIFQPSEYALVFKSQKYPQCGLLCDTWRHFFDVIGSIHDENKGGE